MRRWWVVVLFLAAVSGPGCGDDDGDADCDGVRAAMLASLAVIEEGEEGRIAGAVVGVETPACGTMIEVTGLSNVESETPMTPDLVFPIGSITKTFTGAVSA